MCKQILRCTQRCALVACNEIIGIELAAHVIFAVGYVHTFAAKMVRISSTFRTVDRVFFLNCQVNQNAASRICVGLNFIETHATVDLPNCKRTQTLRIRACAHTTFIWKINYYIKERGVNDTYVYVGVKRYNLYAHMCVCIKGKKEWA